MRRLIKNLTAKNPADNPAAFELYSQALTAIFHQDWSTARRIFDQVLDKYGHYHETEDLRTLAARHVTTERERWEALRILVPKDNQVPKSRVAQIFASLPTEGFTASFEILGIGGKVVFQVAAPKKHLHLVRAPLEAAYPDAQLTEGKDAIDEALNKLPSSGVLHGRVYNLFLSNPFYYPLQVQERVDPTPGLINLLTQLPVGLAGLQVIVSPLNKAHFEIFDKLFREVKSGTDHFQQRVDRMEFKDQYGITAGEVAEEYEKKSQHPLLTATLQIFIFSPDRGLAEGGFSGLGGYFKQFRGEKNGLASADGDKGLSLTESIKLVRTRRVQLPPEKRDIFNAYEMTNFWMLPWADGITPSVEAGTIRRTFAPEQAVRGPGVPIGVNPYKGEQRRVHLTRDDRRRHLYVVGGTGTGKSTFMRNLINYDLQQGGGLALIDPKGDMVDEVLELISPERAAQVIWIDPSDPDRSVGLNPLEPVPQERRGLAASEMVSILRKLFDSWGPQLERYLRYAALTLLEVPDATMAEIPLLFMSPDFRRQALKHVTDGMVNDFWAFEFGDKPARSNVTISAMLNRIEPFLSDQRVRHIIGQSESTFDVASAMNNGYILLADLSKGKIGEHASNLLGAMLVSKIQLAAMARANIPEERRRDFYLYVDEFQSFTTSAFETILAEARAFRLSLTMAHQYIGQLEKSVRDAVIGTVGSTVAFRVGTDDATVLARQMPGITADELVTLDNYHALARISVEGKTSDPFDLATYPPPENPDAMPAEEVRQIARDRYTKPRVEIEDEIKERRSQQLKVQVSTTTSQTQFEE